MNTFLLAWRYINFHRGRTIVLVSAVTLMVFLPLATRWGVASFEARALSRAESTPLVVGSKTSRFALAIHALYFRGESPAPMKFSEVRRLEEFQLAKVVPIHCRFRTQGHSIVGTTPEYFAMHKLVLASGDPLERLGDCVVGANAAAALGVNSGDKLLSESENLFDLSGASPLRMRVTGILARSHTADDDVVFCDLKTAWIMEGIGHGHESAQEDSDEHTHAASRQNLSLIQEVTEQNFRSFHFHGNRNNYPISAIIAFPDSQRSETLLQGKYLETDQQYQIIRPMDVMTELLELISRVRRLLEIGMLALTIATILLIVLVLLLSLRLRRKEIRTLFLMGCTRGKLIRIVASELGLVVMGSCLLAIALAYGFSRFAEPLLIRLLA